MPQNNTITIKDGAATPVDHVFYPTGIDATNVASFQERVSGVPVGSPSITWRVRGPSSSSPVYKVSGKLSLPKLVTVTGSDGKTVSVVDYVSLATVELMLSERSTKQERKDLRVELSNLLINTAIASTVDDLENFW